MKTLQLTLITAIMIILSLACVQALTITSVSMYPDEIAPGEASEITIGIENEGKNDIEDVSVSLDLTLVPFAPYDSSSEFTIDEIEDDDLEYAKFEIIALSDASSGIYKIPLQISYEEDDEMKTKSSLIGITVNSEPIIGVNIEDGLFLKPQENEIDIKIINKGLSDVKFLEIEIGSSTYFNVLSVKNVYIGDVDSDDFDSAGFRIYFKENAPNSVTLPVSVTYKDAVNNKYTEDYSLKVNVYTKKKAIELGLLERSRTTMYIGIVVALVIIYVGYRKIKKRRKLRKAKEASLALGG